MYEVFIAEDEPPIADMISDMVNDAPGEFHVAVIAHDGQTMLGLLAKRRADVLLADIRMPVMDGLALIEAARTKYPDLICIILTSHAEFEYARNALQKGAFDYVLKTKLPESLNQALAGASIVLERLRWKREREIINQLLVMPSQAAKPAKQPALPYSSFQVWLVGPDFDKLQNGLLPAGSATHDFGSVGSTRHLVLACFSLSPPSDAKTDIFRGESFSRIGDFPSMVAKLLDRFMQATDPEAPSDAIHAASMVRDCLDRQVGELFNFAGISSSTGYNALYLARVFKTAFGISPKRYHTKAKIALISAMLDENPSLLLKEVAAKINFEDELYLSKVFKQETGLTFSEYRDRIKLR